MFRRPRWAYAALGLLIVLALGYALTVFVASGIGFDARVAEALAWPAAIGAGLAGGLLWGRIAKCRVRRHRDAGLASALAWSAAGFAWQLSFGLAAWIDGGDLAVMRHSIAPALVGGALAAAAGGIAGFAASLAALTRR